MPNEQNDILTDKLSGWRGEKGRNVYKKLKAVSRQPLTNFVNLKSNTIMKKPHCKCTDTSVIVNR